MARNKETLVVLVDVSPSMHPYLHLASKCISTLVHRKLMLSKSDELGLVYFGSTGEHSGVFAKISSGQVSVRCSTDTDNELNKELSGYQNIVVARPIAVVAEDLASCLENIPPGWGASDFLDAIVVGCDLVVKRVGGKKGNKRLCLITDAESPLRESDKGTIAEQVDLIAEKMGHDGIKLEAVVVRIGQGKYISNSTPCYENESYLERFKSHAKAEVVIAQTATSMLGAIRSRTVAPTTLFRGDLELTPSMSVKVWVYKKTAQEKFPSLKKFSDKAPPTDPHATREVKMDTEYKSLDNPDLSIPPEQRTKAYRYGKNFIPISGAMEDAYKLKTEKGLKLIGFIPASDMPRHYYLKEANIFVPEPGHQKSILAVSALARAMEASNQIALVRCVWRQGQNNVVLGVLTPYLATEDNVADAFYFNVVPFSDDMREFTFNNFKSVPESLQPNEAQQEAADNFVRMLDLAPDGGEELLQPEHTVNPILQRFYRFLHARALDPEAEVPPVDDALRCIVEPDPDLLAENRFAIGQFSGQLTLIPNVQKEKGGRRFWRDKHTDGDGLQIKDEDGAAMDVDTAAGGQISFSSLGGRQVEEVGSVDPVKDFEALLARRDSPDWVEKALKGMKRMINDLLDSSYNGNTFEKALACLVALRSGCVVQEEPLEFNAFLHELANKCRGKRFNNFWQQVVSKKVSLISKDEAPDSDVGVDEAASFLAGERVGVQAPKEEPADEIDEMEALLGEAM